MFLIVLSMKMKQLSSAHGYVFKISFQQSKVWHLQKKPSSSGLDNK